MKTRWGGIGGALAAIGTLILLIVIGWLVYQTGYRDGQTRQTDSDATTEETVPTPTARPTPSTNRDDKSELVEYRSEAGVVIKLDRQFDNTAITSPLTISGEVPGNWSFEADFPVELRTVDGVALVTEPATLQGDWMTTNYVPFKVTLTFSNIKDATAGQLILHKSNPSGLSEHDDRVTIPVRLSARE